MCQGVSLRRFVSTSVVLAAFVTALAGIHCHAQQGGQVSSTAALNTTTQVEVPVIVRDKRGAPVIGLAAADLTLSDNGYPQVIRTLVGGSDAPLRVGLLVDTSRGMLRALDSQRKAAENFIVLAFQAKAPGANLPAEAFLIHFDNEVELLEDLTASQDKLHSDLEQMGPTQRSANSEGPETTDSESTRRNFRTGSPQLYDAIFLASSEVMKAMRGRKALIVFSNGVDGGSRESLNDAVEAAERVSAPVYTIFFKGNQQRSEEALPGERRRGGWPGSGGGWPGNRPGDSRGSRSPQIDGKKILQQIATRTGGLYFDARKTAELADIYSQIATDLQGQYVLSYIPDKSAGDAEFHKIEVKAAQKDVSIAAPEGYFQTQADAR